jgi:hypothetical protein
MRCDALFGALRMRERNYNFSAHFRVVLSYRHATRRRTETQTVYDPQREILRMRD